MDEEDLLNALAVLYEDASVELTGNDVIALGTLTVTEVAAFQTPVGKDLTGFNKVVKFNAARHIANTHSKSHEKLNGQKQIESEHFTNIPNVLLNYDSITFQPRNHKMGKHQDSILFEKGSYSVVCEIIYNKKELSLKTMWVKK